MDEDMATWKTWIRTWEYGLGHGNMETRTCRHREMADMGDTFHFLSHLPMLLLCFRIGENHLSLMMT
jgi:hypothetical protein